MTNDLTGALAEIEAALDAMVDYSYLNERAQEKSNAPELAKQALAKCKALREAVPDRAEQRSNAVINKEAAALLQQFIQEEK